MYFALDSAERVSPFLPVLLILFLFFLRARSEENGTPAGYYWLLCVSWWCRSVTEVSPLYSRSPPGAPGYTRLYARLGRGLAGAPLPSASGLCEDTNPGSLALSGVSALRLRLLLDEEQPAAARRLAQAPQQAATCRRSS